MKTVRDACQVQPNALAIKLSDQIEQLDELISLEGDGSNTDALVQALLDRPELRSLRAVHGVSEAAATTIASGRPRALVELSWTDAGRDQTAAKNHALAACRALPDLRVLGSC